MVGDRALDGPVFLPPVSGGKRVSDNETRSLLDAHHQSLVSCIESVASRQERLLQRLESRIDELINAPRPRPSPRQHKAKTRDNTTSSRGRLRPMQSSFTIDTSGASEAARLTYAKSRKTTSSSMGLDSGLPDTPPAFESPRPSPRAGKESVLTFTTNENRNSARTDDGPSPRSARSTAKSALARTLSMGSRDFESEGFGSERAPRASLDSLHQVFERGRTNSRLLRNETRWKGQRDSSLRGLRTSRISEWLVESRQKGFFMSLLSVMLNLVNSGNLDALTGVIIVVDTLLIGVEADYIARNGTTIKFFFYSSIVFTAWYTLELVLRMFASGVNQFLRGPDWRWNLFDIMSVLVSIFDLVAQAIQISGGPLSRVLRVIRIIRVVRDLRLVRMIRDVREFRKMVFALAYSLHTLFWSLLLFVSLIFVFGTIFTQVTSDYFAVIHQGEFTLEDEDLKNSFGTMESSMFSLYAAITSGRNWGEQAKLLQKIHWGVMLVFVMYLSISFFGVMNIVTAVFVESAMHSSKHYKDLLVQEKSLDDQTNVKHMKEIFALMDANGDGSLSMEEMRRFLMNEGKDLQKYFQALEISATDTVTLFELLDRDRSGEIDIDEFCEGCIRLRGTAKAFDINTLLHEQRKLKKHLDKFLTHISKRLGAVRDTLAKSSDDEFDCADSGVVLAVV